MFTGIIETLGKVKSITKQGSNYNIEVLSEISEQLKVDQSVSHNGVCLTVVELKKESHLVTAIEETIQKTNLENLKEGDLLNLERCTKIGDRLDGHIVQGHIDGTAICEKIEQLDGSWKFSFCGDKEVETLTVNKGSISINGVSLTIVHTNGRSFSVAIIPYTYENTTFKLIKEGNRVNIEYDIIGKYVMKKNVSL
jgi:riboflavin synthase